MRFSIRSSTTDGSARVDVSPKAPKSLDVTTDADGGTSVTAGKYITDTIYTDVTNNSESGTDISLNIDLTESLTGRATVGEDNDSSIGLFFERDY